MSTVYKYPVSPDQYQKIMNFLDNFADKMFYGRMDLLFKLMEYLRLEEHGIGLKVDSIELIMSSGEQAYVVLDSGWSIVVYGDDKGYWVEFREPCR